MLMPSETVEPLFAHRERDELLTVVQGCQRIQEPGERTAELAPQCRTLLRSNHLHARAKIGTGRTSANLLAPADFAAFRVMRDVYNLGVADPKIISAISDACYAFGFGESALHATAHPISDAIESFKRGGAPVFRLDTFISSNGERVIRAKVYDPERQMPSPPPPNLEPVATVIVPIFRFMARLLSDRSGMN